MLGEIEWIEVFQPTEKIAIFLIFRPTQMDFVRVRNESDIDKKKKRFVKKLINNGQIQIFRKKLRTGNDSIV
jgi:hypothetical protein